MRVWLAMLAVAVVLAGCGIFFALQDLGTANEYASIASFFLALLIASGIGNIPGPVEAQRPDWQQ